MNPPNSSHILLNPDDSVLVALRNLAVGETLDLDGSPAVQVLEPIPAGHKLAISDLDENQPVKKFGWPIGIASEPIKAGSHVHVHNLQCSHQVDPDAISTAIPAKQQPRDATFEGFVRSSGKVGTRNYLAIISNVNCSASVSRMIANHFDADELAAYPNVDGVISFRHDGGCAMAWRGSRHEMLTRVLGGIARHPNIGGYLLVGLGCEQGSLQHLQDSQDLHTIKLPGARAGEFNQDRKIPVLSIQDMGGTRATVERGVELVRELLPEVNNAVRQTVSAEHLSLGLECGGSDGYSGITANPLLGVVSDRLVACGGTAILSETSEIAGAEHLLTRRARTPEIAHKLLERIEWWKTYCGNYGEEFDNNPSVGNKQGGLTTITEKSLGAVSKAGSTALEGVYEYAEPIDSRGFVFMDTPGFDPSSVTGMVAGGANLIAFTTGRGSCFGFKPTPSFKIASNSRLFQRLPEDMDFNAGQLLENKSMDELATELFEALLAVASGKQTCSEILGIGDEEFAPWQVGPVL